MSIKSKIRLRKLSAIEVLKSRRDELKPKMIRWLKGRIAWEMGRKRT